MSDKKNFSVFNKLDEKYVEEADAYSASPKVEKKRRKDEHAARKAKIKSPPPAQYFHKRSRRVAKRIAQIAACVLILFVGIRFGGVGLFKSRHEAPSDGANESSCPESAKDSVEGGGDDDSQDGAASESASASENSGEAEEGQSPSSGPDNESASDSVPDSSSSASDSTDSASEE